VTVFRTRGPDAGGGTRVEPASRGPLRLPERAPAAAPCRRTAAHAASPTEGTSPATTGPSPRSPLRPSLRLGGRRAEVACVPRCVRPPLRPSGRRPGHDLRRVCVGRSFGRGSDEWVCRTDRDADTRDIYSCRLAGVRCGCQCLGRRGRSWGAFDPAFADRPPVRLAGCGTRQVRLAPPSSLAVRSRCGRQGFWQSCPAAATPFCCPDESAADDASPDHNPVFRSKGTLGSAPSAGPTG
jgi:hypothetical protein